MKSEKTVRLLISLEQKNMAKAIASSENKAIHWDEEKKEWFFPGEEADLPEKLKAFLYPFHPDLPQDFILTLPQADYQKIKKGIAPQAGTIRWDLRLQRAIWRGNILPKELQAYLPKKTEPEAFFSQISNEPVREIKKKIYSVTSETEKLALPEAPELHVQLSPGLIRKKAWECDATFLEHLFPSQGSTQLKTFFKGRLPRILISGLPTFSHRSREAILLTALIHQSQETHILLPKGEINPLQTFHCLHTLEKKYRRKIPLNSFPEILPAFGLQITKRSFQETWTPNPEKDKQYLEVLLHPLT